MLTVMITGGIGSGKSSLRRMMCDKGAVSIDLDAIARTLLENEQQMINELADEFGPQILDEQGAVIRSELAAAAFSSDAATRAMNAITFPYIQREATEYLLNVHCTPRTNAPVLVVEVPLLTEMPDFAELADEVIAVEVPVVTRLARCVERGMDAEDAIARMNRQATDAERATLATVICDNNGLQEDLRAWVDAWWSERVEGNAPQLPLGE